MENEIMYGAMERLQSLRVAEAMTTHVIHLRAWQPLCEVAALFRAHEISAAPVLDEWDRCVGILSATDFLRRDAACGDYQAYGSRSCKCRISRSLDDGTVRVSSPAQDTVADWMTDAMQSVSSESSLALAARIMCAQHVHRLVVLDGRHRVSGLISTMDITAAVMNALDEVQITGSPAITERVSRRERAFA